MVQILIDRLVFWLKKKKKKNEKLFTILLFREEREPKQLIM